MHFLLTISLLLGCGLAHGETIRMLIQSSPLAGSQYYEAVPAAAEMKIGDPLQLIREPENRYDRRAIRVEWRGRKLGYVPRAENRTVSAAMDSGERISARISKLRDDPNPWKRVEFEVLMEL